MYEHPISFCPNTPVLFWGVNISVFGPGYLFHPITARHLPTPISLSCTPPVPVAYAAARERRVTNPKRSIMGSDQISLIHCNTGVRRTSEQYEASGRRQNNGRT